ncbi:MAG: CBS domain-containing protein [Chloroflexi bacterium]|nr:CBS domain-containing protein [Chloroflexota bacterium]
MPREGKATRVIDIVRRDISTCALNDRLGDINEKVSSAGKNVCVVLNDEQIVLGRVRGKAFDGDPDTKVEDAMRSGPATIRPDVFLHDIGPRMHDRRVGSYIVTTALGRFVGILYRDDADRALDDQVKRDH